MSLSQRNTRRSLLCGGAVVGLAYAAGNRLAAAEQDASEIPVSATEDLMREHGIVSRSLLIYEEAGRRLRAGKDLPQGAVKNTAEIIRSFIHDYHEKSEEDYLFPRFEKAGKLVDLVKVLRTQHDAGRKVTETIQQLAEKPSPEANESKRLVDSLRLFSRMYRPHKAWEDTVLFPAFHEIIKPKEYDELGEQFEAKEQQLFGPKGFEKTIERLAGIEKQLGIHDLAQFTPPG